MEENKESELYQLRVLLEEQKEKYIDSRFESMQNSINAVKESLEEVKSLLKENISQMSTNIGKLDNRIDNLEIKHEKCPVHTVKDDLKTVKDETKFIRFVFANGWRGVTILTLWIILIIYIVIAFGPDSVLNFLTKLK